MLGVYIHIQKGRHRAAYALIDGQQLLDQGAVKAPTENVGKSLGELHGWASDLIRRHRPTLLAMRLYDVRRGKLAVKDEDIRLTTHAQGAVLAAAGSLGLTAVTYSGAALRKAGKSAQEAANERCAGLSPAPKEAAVAQAAAVALVAIQKTRKTSPVP